MPRDYKNRVNRSSKKKASAPPWLWVLVGLMLGAFAMGLVWLKMDAPRQDDQWLSAKPDREPKRADPVEPVNTVPPHQPRFEFFDKLREQEVSVPDEQLDLRKGLDGADPTARYVVQVGSFVNPVDADRVKAELTLLGIDVRVNKVNIAADKVRYRVMAGPYLGKSSLERARTKLQQNGYKKILIRALR